MDNGGKLQKVGKYINNHFNKQNKISNISFKNNNPYLKILKQANTKRMPEKIISIILVIISTSIKRFAYLTNLTLHMKIRLGNNLCLENIKYN